MGKDAVRYANYDVERILHDLGSIHWELESLIWSSNELVKGSMQMFKMALISLLISSIGVFAAIVALILVYGR